MYSILEILIYAAGIVFIGINYWILLMIMATNTLAVGVSEELFKALEKKKEGCEENNISYA